MPHTTDQARSLQDITTLAAIERLRWAEQLSALRAAGVPLNAEDPPKDPPATGDPKPDPAPDPPADPKPEPPKGDLGPGGEAALKAERKLRQDAEKRAKAEKDRADALEAAQLSDMEREKKRADDAEAELAKATRLVRDANLTQALSTAGVAHAAATARLLDGVEFDDVTHRPTNLDAALASAKETYGDDVIRMARRSGANINGGSGGDTGDTGPRLTPEELAAATSAGMSPAEYEHYKNPAAGPYQPAKT
jgi:hypothetical protein